MTTMVTETLVGGRKARRSGGRLARLRSLDLADTRGRRLALVRKAGAGGMGEVYEALDPALGQRLAVKLVQPGRSDDRLERFAAEAEILETLDHPAIVAYVGHGTTPRGQPYIAMQWLDGHDLGHHLEAGPLSLRDAVVVARRLADGLAAAHRAGVIHRDLKPRNIVLVDGDVARATLVDFGVARRAGSDVTRTGDLVGTPGYMAPEQARGRRDLDARADLFALGCVLHHCVAGRPPFAADDIMTVLARLLLETPPGLRRLRRDVPRRLDRLVARLLAKDPADRPADAAEVSAELAAIGAALDRGATGTRGRRAIGRWCAAVAVAAAVVVAICLARTASRQGSPASRADGIASVGEGTGGKP